VGRARAQARMPGPVADVEALWYDTSRWPAFVDGLRSVHRVEGEWPRPGSRVIWDSVSNGRGRVIERVTGYEPRSGQACEVEDPRIEGTQAIGFTADGDACVVTMELRWTVKDHGPLGAVVDLLFVRRAFGDALRHTLARLARERRSDVGA
jgi:hypothetical protein